MKDRKEKEKEIVDTISGFILLVSLITMLLIIGFSTREEKVIGYRDIESYYYSQQE